VRVTLKEIKEVLKEAGRVHHDYEENILGGEFDKNWSGWYAAFIIGRLPGIGSPTKLTRLLKEASEEHKKKNQDTDWIEFYSNYLVKKL